MGNITANDVYNMVCEFFKITTGEEGAECCAETVKTGDARNQDCPVACYVTPCLLEIACMGNAERTMQGELLHYLRCRGLYALNEGSYVAAAANRSIDIMVFDNDTPRKPLVAIELKHDDPHLGSIKRLYGAGSGLYADYTKSRLDEPTQLPDDLPLIQIALFSAVTDICSGPGASLTPSFVPHQDFMFHRFIRCYVLGGKSYVPVTTVQAHKATFDAWLKPTPGSPVLPAPAPAYRKSTGGLIIGAEQTFDVPNSTPGAGAYQVTGCVSYFAGLI